LRRQTWVKSGAAFLGWRRAAAAADDEAPGNFPDRSGVIELRSIAPAAGAALGGAFESPLAGTAKQDAIDVVLSTAEKSIVQLEASVANRVRKRSRAASCNASLSVGVLTVT